MGLHHGRVLAVVTLLAASVGAQQADVPAQGPQTGTQTMVAFDGGTAAAGAGWVDMGKGGLAGSQGVPVLTGTGSLGGDTAASVDLSNARPGSSAFLVVGFADASVPFRGGLMVPSVDMIHFTGATDAGGSARQVGRWPVGVPTGLTLYYQFWVVDAAGPQGLAASNALQSTAP